MSMYDLHFAFRFLLVFQPNDEMLYNETSLFLQATGFEWFAFYNIMLDKPTEGDADFVPRLEKEEIRAATVFPMTMSTSQLKNSSMSTMTLK